MMKRVKETWLSILSVLLFAFATPAFAQEEPVDAEAMQQATESVEADVQSETNKATAERRQKIMQEAIDALSKTNDALTALDEERVADALEALAVTTGKLELIVAREPELALAPTDVAIIRHDLYATTDAIEAAIDRARSALKNGEIQEARRLLNGLGSELVISVTNLPLATYPDAIKAITPLIDDGKIDEAKRSLRAALNTVVVTDQVVPLPVLRSEALLKRTEELAEISDRSEDENKELTDTLAAVRNQLAMAELLGYGDQGDYESLYAQLEDIRKKTKDGQSGKGLFDTMKVAMSELWNSITS
jgi:hypothetical protein